MSVQFFGPSIYYMGTGTLTGRKQQIVRVSAVGSIVWEFFVILSTCSRKDLPVKVSIGLVGHR